ncbi:alkaline phosphatase D family protein [Pareuzebyella sediminis]|uniref:alkaline phosphatase D family protein n=1 Tax=Pareuzebyella sediminis TaxID=2607998 RepID=UPI0011EBF0AE|nr:alkaline phosphatase D family protein [Pareuzebyella sediminis]
MKIKRRKFLQNLGLAVPFLASSFDPTSAKNTPDTTVRPRSKPASFYQSFNDINNRIWIGKDFWAVPMEDWKIKNGHLLFSGVKKNARLHVLTQVLKKGKGNFVVEGELGLKDTYIGVTTTGFALGIKDTTDPDSVKAACYFGKGVSIGISTDGTLFIDEKTTTLPKGFNRKGFSLKVLGSSDGSTTQLKLVATDKKGQSVSLDHVVADVCEGLVAIENRTSAKSDMPFFWEWIEISGEKTEHRPENSFGPILLAMYTLSESRLRMTAQLPPMGQKDSDEVKLQFQKGGQWRTEASVEIDPVSFTGIFTIDEYQAIEDVKYRLVYELDGKEHYYEGTIRKEPLDRPLLFGGLTCQEWGGYPYRPLVENLEKSNPDMLYFSGDQLYEGNGGYPIKRAPEDDAILNYLGKWFMFGWAFGHLLRDRPSICTPDDHDVYQGNLWGEAGERITIEAWEKVKDAHGGLVQTAKMVNVVNRTQCGHLPEAFDTTLLKSGMTTWYTHLVYGKVSFAIISDRLFKSGPERIRKGTGRIDHLIEPTDPNDLDAKELTLVGNRQLDFLNVWVSDWEGANMKVLLSQTLFANVATHHGPQKEFLFGDLDSGGWPKSKRDHVIDVVRKAAVFHINGDQHLPFLVKYGIEAEKDGIWAFCTPAISTGYPRWAEPDKMNMPFTDRPSHQLPNTGNYRDGFGNTNFVYAVGNPTDDFHDEQNRYVKAHKKASGYGLVTFDTKARTIKMEAIRFLANASEEPEINTYPGWPLTIKQVDNDGRRPLGYLPRLQILKSDQLVQVYKEDDNTLVSAIRVKGTSYTPSVYEMGTYTVVVGEKNRQTIKNVQITRDPEAVIRLD